MRIPECVSVRKKTLVKNGVSAAVLAVGLVLYLYKTEGAWKIGDGLFLAGLLFLVIGCWYLVRWMGLFDFTVYGYKKLIHHMEATRKNAPAMEPMPSYVDYLKQPKVIPSAGEPLLTAVVLVALSVLTTVVF